MSTNPNPNPNPITSNSSQLWLSQVSKSIWKYRRLVTVNGISIGSVIFAQFTHRHTDTQTTLRAPTG